MQKEMDHHAIHGSVAIINRCDHIYEVSSYICNPIRLALIWPDNSFEEIYKWEIGASNYLDLSFIYLITGWFSNSASLSSIFASSILCSSKMGLFPQSLDSAI